MSIHTTTAPAALDLVLADDSSELTLDVAADIGNARAICLIRFGEQVREVVMPAIRSLHGVSSFDLFTRRSLPAHSWGQLAADEHIICRDGIERFVGRLAADEAPAASSGRGSDRRYVDGTTLDFILASIASAHPKASSVAVRLVPIVPISLWPLLAQRVEQSLKATWKYGYCGRELTCRVSTVSCLREAEVAYKALPPRSGRGFILDGGGRTFNVALFADGEYKAGATIDAMGVEAAIDAVDRELLSQSVSPLTLAERIELLDAMREQRPYHIVARNARLRVDTIARKHFDAAATALVQELHSKIKVESAEWAAFVGGAAYPAFMGARVHELLPFVSLIDKPETINVYGALASLGGQVRSKGKRR